MPQSKLRKFALAIDLGTGGPKVALVADDGAIAARAARAVETQHLPPDGAEQDPEEIWRSILGAIREVLAEAAAPKEAICGIMCSAQFFSIVPIDSEGRPLTKLLMWLDRRGAPFSRALFEREPDALFRFIEIHGGIPFGSDSLSHMLHVKELHPEIYERTHAFLEPVDFVTQRLTGVTSGNVCTVFPMLLTDNRRPEETSYSKELLELTGIDEHRLPPLVPVDAQVGTLRPELAQELDLSADIPVFSGMNDTQAVTIGAGAHRAGFGGLNIGTTMQILASAPEKHTDPENQIVSMPSPLAGSYMAMAEIGLGGRTLEHFLRAVVHARDPLGDHRVSDPFAGLDAAVSAEPAGSGKLLYLPFLTGGGGPSGSGLMRGAFLNLSLETTRTRMLRAVLEGVALHQRWARPAVERFSGQPFTEITVSGGGARSDAWVQILADVHDRPMQQLDDARHANTRGNAFLTFQRLGLTGPDQIDRFRPIRRSYEPRSEHRQLYDELFEQFVAAYDRVQPISEALNR